MKRIFVLTVTILSLATVSITSHAIREAYIGFEDMNPGDSWEDDMARYLESKLLGWGYPVVDVRQADYHIYSYNWGHYPNYWEVWADENTETYGWDDTYYVEPHLIGLPNRDAIHGVDNYDIAFLYAHGVKKTCDAREGHFGGIKLGGMEHSTLYISNRSSKNDVHWGNVDLNTVILKSCAQTQQCVFLGGGYDFISGPQLSMMLGYHGNSSNDSTVYNRFKDFVDGSKYNDLGSNWVDEMTIFKSGSDNDNCATAVIWAKDHITDATRIWRETGFLDYETAIKQRVYFFGWEGCDPKNGPPIFASVIRHNMP